MANYWLTGEPNEKSGNMFIDLGCLVEVVGFKATNTHNYIWNNYATKDFKVFIRNWEYPYHNGHITHSHHGSVNNKWTEVLSASLPDSRGQQCNVETQVFLINSTVELNTRITRVVRLQIVSSYPDTIGGGLLYFEVMALPCSTACDMDIPVPGKASITFGDSSIKAAARNTGYVGQTVTLTCNEGYEFADTPELVTTEPAAPNPIAAIDVSESSWGPWESSQCSVTCGSGTLARTRKCDKPGACRGDYSQDAATCDMSACREYIDMIYK